MQKTIRYLIIILIFSIFKIEDCMSDFDKYKDARKIVDSKFDPKTIAKILPFRTKEECDAINNAVAEINDNKPLVDPKYIPMDKNRTPYDDLVFALVKDYMTVFSMYMGQYLDRKDAPYIIMVFIQIDERLGFKKVYNEQHDHSFDDAREDLGHPFSNAFRVWAEADRQNEVLSSAINPCCSKGQYLQDERSTWNKKKRDDLEYVLMKQSYEDSKCSVRCYGTRIVGQPANFLDDIKNNIKDQTLVDIYSSLLDYVQSQENYWAHKLHDHCDGRDNWSIWIILLTTRRGDPVVAIDNAFKNLYQNTTLKDYISKCNFQDPVLKQMLTDLADSASASQRQTPPPPPPESEEYCNPGGYEDFYYD